MLLKPFLNKDLMITNNEFKRRLMLGEIARRGLRYEQHGTGWRVFGPGVDVITTDIAFLQTQDLKPTTYRYEPA